MTHIVKDLRKSEDGFTLVELAVVMIIIGLLIAGILKGQELIANARITSTISQMQGIGAAVDGFTEAYNATPGDMNNAVARLVNCNNACVDGNGNGLVDINVGSAPTAADEANAFYVHLALANFITGVDNSAAGPAFGISIPTAPIGGGYFVGDTRNGVTGFAVGELRSGLYIVHHGTLADVDGTGGELSGAQAARIDRRLDDGAPNSGVVVSDTSGGAGGCRDAANGTVYFEADPASNCALAYKM